MEEQKEENLYIIQDLYDLITPQIPCDQSRILAVNYSRLRCSNQYGSAMLKLNIELVNTTTGEDWTLPALAKTLPTYSSSQDIADIQAVFKNEVGIYTIARRAVDAFLKQKGVINGEDFFNINLGGRINLNGTNVVDHNAALIMSDLIAMGYKFAHRRTGFDCESTKAILATLAKFHASTIALKVHQPKEFKDKIRPYLGKYYTAANFEETARSQMISVLKNEGFSPGAIERAVATFDRRSLREVREPWATFAHTNAWVKNILVKWDRNKKPIDVRLKGFQESEYNSPLRDLIFFLFTSVELVTLRQHLDELIDFYYYHFINNLSRLDVDTKAFAKPLFNQELKATASRSEFYKTVCMLYPVLATNRDFWSIVDEDYVPDLKDPLHIKKLCSIVKEFDRRNWLCS